MAFIETDPLGLEPLGLGGQKALGTQTRYEQIMVSSFDLNQYLLLPGTISGTYKIDLGGQEGYVMCLQASC
jgi:hypothetical protein